MAIFFCIRTNAVSVFKIDAQVFDGLGLKLATHAVWRALIAGLERDLAQLANRIGTETMRAAVERLDRLSHRLIRHVDDAIFARFGMQHQMQIALFGIIKPEPVAQLAAR